VAAASTNASGLVARSDAGAGLADCLIFTLPLACHACFVMVLAAGAMRLAAE
jgi:hypothetical protein